MSDELTVSTSVQLTKGDVKNKGASYNGSKVTQVGTGCILNVQTAIGVSAEALELGSITTPGRYVAKNVGTKTLQIGSMLSGTFVPFEELLTLESASGRMATVAPYVLCTEAGETADLEYFIAEA